MATTYGAPTSLDLSACSVTPTGGTSSQTLADMGKAVADNATGIAAAQSDASDAKTLAGTANDTANAASDKVDNLGNIYLPLTARDAAGGVVGLDNGGGINVKSGYLTLGAGANNVAGASPGIIQLAAQTGATNPNMRLISWCVGSQAGQCNLSFNPNYAGMTTDGSIGAFTPEGDGKANLGLASNAWDNIFSKTAVQVTSDATQKTIIGSLADTSYADGQKLTDALFGLDTEIFQLNASIAEKGADNARLHAGFIAQKVEAALTAAGLDPAKYALWSNSPVIEIVNKPTGEKDDKGNDITVSVGVQATNADGTPKYTQMLRYDQIMCVLFEAAKAKITEQESALSALTTRVVALEVKAGA